MSIWGANGGTGVFVDVCTVKADHDLAVQSTGNADEVEVGDDEFCNPSTGGSSAGHDIDVSKNSAFFIDVGNNTAGHQLTVSTNTAASGGYIDVSDNTVGHDAVCSASSPAMSKDGADDHANSVGHFNSCG